jgi:hypothetical protein
MDTPQKQSPGDRKAIYYGGMAHTVRPRLTAVGADLDRVFIVCRKRSLAQRLLRLPSEIISSRVRQVGQP